MSYAFGDCEIDLERQELRRDGSPVKLERKVYQVLAYLVEHRGHVVTRDELLDQLWPGVYVDDIAVTRCISAARKAVGDSPRAQRVIKTLHGRGYRFIAPLVADQPPATVPNGQLLSLPETPDSHFVGRTTALELLNNRLQLARQGQRQLVFIAGDAGVGKTTLVHTFIAQAQAMTTLRLAAGQCMETYGSGEACVPVLEAIERLCRAPDGTVGGHYAFRHALYQQVTYERIPETRRVRYHWTIGDRLETGYANHERAIPHYLQAGEVARWRHTPHEAIAHLTHGLDLLHTLPATSETARTELAMQIALGSTMMTMQLYTIPEAEHAFDQARTLGQQVGDTPLSAGTHLGA